MSKAKRRREKVKRAQSRKKSKRIEKKKVFSKGFKIGILGITVLLILVGYLIYLTVLITGIKKNDPLSSNGSSSYLLAGTSFDDLDKTLWIFEKGNGDDASISEAFFIASNKEKKLLLSVYIPSWIYFSSTEEKFGSALTVSNFKYGGDFLEDGRGVEYAIWQFEQMLGTKIDNYVWIGDSEQSLYTEIFGDYRDYKGDFGYDSEEEDLMQESFMLDSFISKFSFLRIPFYPRKFSKVGEGIISNKNFAEIVGKISSTDRKLKGYEKYMIDLGSPRFVEEELSKTGGIAYYFNSQKYDEAFREYLLSMLDKELEKEQVRVEVYNGSGISGVAGQMARRVENSGCDVVRYENAPDLADHTTLYIPDEKRFKNSIAVVKEVVGTNVEVINERPKFMTTGDIVIVLGKDIERIYSF